MFVCVDGIGKGQQRNAGSADTSAADSSEDASASLVHDHRGRRALALAPTNLGPSVRRMRKIEHSVLKIDVNEIT